MVVLGWRVLAARTGAIGRTGLGLCGCVTTGSTTAAGPGTGLRARGASRRGASRYSRRTARVRTSSRTTGSTSTSYRTGMRKRLPRRSWRLKGEGERCVGCCHGAHLRTEPGEDQSRRGRGGQFLAPRPGLQGRPHDCEESLKQLSPPPSVCVTYTITATEPSLPTPHRRTSAAAIPTHPLQPQLPVSCARSEGKHRVSAA